MPAHIDVLAVGRGSSLRAFEEINVRDSIQNAGFIDFGYALKIPSFAPVAIQNDGFMTTVMMDSQFGFTIDGVGEWRVGDRDHLFAQGGSIVNGPDHLISSGHGIGTLRVPFQSSESLGFINFGSVQSGEGQLILSGTTENFGLMRTEDNGDLVVRGLTNHGTLQIDSGIIATLHTTNTASGTIEGDGTLSMHGTAPITLTSYGLISPGTGQSPVGNLNTGRER